ncbi:MAG: hypothetical protein U0802_21315 [Candidatus Binatia bacterium]
MAVAACLAVPAVLHAQTPRPLGALLASVPDAASAGAATATEWTLQTGDPATAEALVDVAPALTLRAVARRPVPASFVRGRRPEWRAGDLIAVGVDAAGRELFWQRLVDPRVVRAEFPGPDGVIQGQTSSASMPPRGSPSPMSVPSPCASSPPWSTIATPRCAT